MAGKPSPITPAVLAWAVREDGRPTVEIAEAVGVDEAVLDSWMQPGEDRPVVGQVSKLANALNRPRAVFFLPTAPESATLPASFRHPPGDDRNVGPSARRRLRQARRIQAVLIDALADQPAVDLPTASVATPTDVAAAEARTWLGISEAEQLSWADDFAALRAWRQAFDERGVFVFSLEIGERRRQTPAAGRANPLAEDVRGFSAWDDQAPLIVMNSLRVNPAARIFTLGHELGHLSTRLDAACIENEPDQLGQMDEPVERWCEAFAAALLMPESLVRQLMRERGVTGPNATLDDVRVLTRRLNVSGRAGANRLIDLGLAPRGLYRAVLAAFRPAAPTEPARPIASAPRSTLRVRQYGTRALDAVLREVDALDALSILQMTVPDVRELVDTVPSAAVV